MKKVSSSRNKRETVVVAEGELDEQALRSVISATGYDVGDIQKEPYVKRGLFG